MLKMATSESNTMLQPTFQDKFTDEKKDSNSENTTILTSTSCPICQEDFDEPKLLPCAHHLCRKCMVTWLKSTNGKPTCPLCRIRIFSEANELLEPEALADSLPTDVVLAALVESTRILSIAHVCSACEESVVAINFCFHCGDKLCGACTAYHARMNITKFHEIKPLAGLTPALLAISKQEKCGTHAREYLELYCPKHLQPICIQCLSTSHTDCGQIKTIANVAKHQRETVQAQVDKLVQANVTLDHESDNIQRHQHELSQSQGDCRKELSALIGRLSTALFSRENELNADVDKIPESLKKSLKQRKEQVEERRCLTTACLKQTTEFLLYASDVNMTRLAGVHAARAARIASQIAKSSDISSAQVAWLKTDEGDIRHIEELIRTLGNISVSTLESKMKDSSNNAVMVEAKRSLKHLNEYWSTKGASALFHNLPPLLLDPFQAKFTKTVLFSTSDRFCAICLTFDEKLLLTSAKTNIMYMAVTTVKPCTVTKLYTFPTKVRAMTLLSDGTIAVTTNSNSIYFVDTYKNPVRIRRIETTISYWGITSGIDDTLIVSNDGKQSSFVTPSIDVITKDGQFMGTLADSKSCPKMEKPKYVCRVRDHVLVSDFKNSVIIRTSLDKYIDRNRILKIGECITSAMICSDCAGNLYIVYQCAHAAVLAMDGRLRNLDSFCGGMYSVCAYPNGSGIILGNYNQDDILSIKFYK